MKRNEIAGKCLTIFELDINDFVTATLHKLIEKSLLTVVRNLKFRDPWYV